MLNGGSASTAFGANADGSVVVGASADGTAGDKSRAFLWTPTTGMHGLGTLNDGDYSIALGTNSDGRVVVGYGDDGAAGNAYRAFRWTRAHGMQTVEDWLRSTGVAVLINTVSATGTNGDGSVVVGNLTNGFAYIARGSSGLITLSDARNSLSTASIGGGMVLSAVSTVLNGAHSRPLAHRVDAGQTAFWVAGDWGHDDHDIRAAEMGLAELSLGHNFGAVQLNASLGKTWAKKNFELNGEARTGGDYLLVEALLPISGNLWGTIGAYTQSGKADLRRGYLNAGLPDTSIGKPHVDANGFRARLDWDGAVTVVGAGLTPYVDLTYIHATTAAFTETGGGFPARFNARNDKASELRFGVNAIRPLNNNARLTGVLEATHRMANTASHTVGQVIGLFGFDLDAPAVKKDWVRAGIGVDARLGDGVASLTLNATTNGAAASSWLAASWQSVF